jgi:aconitate hydratase
MLALTFANEADYDKILEDDSIDIIDLTSFAPERPLTLVLRHADGTSDTIKVNHTYNKGQIEWFKAGSALNLMAKKTSAPSKAAKAVKKVAKKPVVKKAAKKKAVPKPVKKASAKPSKKQAKKIVKKAVKKIVKAAKKVKKAAKKIVTRKPVKKTVKKAVKKSKR